MKTVLETLGDGTVCRLDVSVDSKGLPKTVRVDIRTGPQAAESAAEQIRHATALIPGSRSMKRFPLALWQTNQAEVVRECVDAGALEWADKCTGYAKQFLERAICLRPEAPLLSDDQREMLKTMTSRIIEVALRGGPGLQQLEAAMRLDS